MVELGLLIHTGSLWEPEVGCGSFADMLRDLFDVEITLLLLFYTTLQHDNKFLS